MIYSGSTITLSVPLPVIVAFVKENHPGILAKEGHQCQSAGKIYDLCAFIHDVIKPTKIPARFPHKVSIHNSCHGVRELFLSAPSELNIPYFNKLRDLLQMVEGIEVLSPPMWTDMLWFRRYVCSRGAGCFSLYGTR